MTKRGFIVHGWDGHPKENWFPWLKKKSDNDPYVPLDNQDDFRRKLGSKIIIEHQMGHFNEDAGITQLPIALESILKIAQ